MASQIVSTTEYWGSGKIFLNFSMKYFLMSWRCIGKWLATFIYRMGWASKNLLFLIETLDCIVSFWELILPTSFAKVNFEFLMYEVRSLNKLLFRLREILEHQFRNISHPHFFLKKKKKSKWIIRISRTVTVVMPTQKKKIPRVGSMTWILLRIWETSNLGMNLEMQIEWGGRLDPVQSWCSIKTYLQFCMELWSSWYATFSWASSVSVTYLLSFTPILKGL